jgi:hypothetical protein
MFRGLHQRALARSLALCAGLLGWLGGAHADPVDYDGLVLGAQLIVPPDLEGVIHSGPLDLRPTPSKLIGGVERVFPPDGLKVGRIETEVNGRVEVHAEPQVNLGYALSGVLVMAADDDFNSPRRWNSGHVVPGTRSVEHYYSGHRLFPGRPRNSIARWHVFGSGPIELIGFDYDGTNHWSMYPEVVDADQLDADGNPALVRRGQLILTWEDVPAVERNIPDNRRNSAQMILTHVGDGDADVELRFARCEWHNQVDNSYYVISGFHTGIVRDDVLHPGQTWYHDDAFAPEIKRMCAYSNVGETGVWRYEMRDGLITGCGLADAPYLPNLDDAPGDRCADDNNTPGDGCSPGCWVEGDADVDGVPDAPPQEPRTPEGLPVNPDGIYDNCVSFTPERDCGDLDSDADNVLNRNDNCEDVPNPAQADFDDDGAGDACQADDDVDGIDDFEDLCPQGHSLVLHRSIGWGDLPPASGYYIQLDNDRDGLEAPGGGRTPGSDVCDPDDDNDGILDCGDDLICPYFDDGVANRVRLRADFSGEGIPEVDDIDNDLDGVVDEFFLELRMAEGSGFVRNRLYDRFDNDEDGIIDEYDEFRRGLPVPPWPGRDADGSEDNCRTIPNPDQANLDGDIWGDPCDEDVDGDYILDCGADKRCAFDRDHRDNDGDGAIDEAEECTAGCDPDRDRVDNDLDGYIDEVPFEFGAPGSSSEYALGAMARESSEALLDFEPWPGPDADGSEDNCPRHRNVEQIDSDGDGVGDACDDDDGDGAFLAAQDPPIAALAGQHAIGAPADNCPIIANPDQVDTDGDAVGDACEIDDDADGVDDDLDNCPRAANPNQNDVDGDGAGDVCDPDIDGDGIDNDEDRCRFLHSTDNTDSDADGDGDACDGDDDNDGVPDPADNCPTVACRDVALQIAEDPCFADLDNDGIGNACDDDDDGDGVPDADDNCPNIANADQLNADRAPDGGDACDDDDDDDEIDDEADNCPRVANANQANLGGDDEGDVCDEDDDNDGVPDVEDGCPRDAQHSANTDGEGLGDDCGDDDDDNDNVDDGDDNCPLIANEDQANVDSDALGDACDPDIDGDAINNARDNCLAVSNVDQRNVDGDEFGDACDDDIDDDGIKNGFDNCASVPNPNQADADSDGQGDACVDPRAIALASCRATTKPLLWAKKCRGPVKKIGCVAAPGEPGGGAWWWAFLAVGLRRRTRG